MFFSIGDGKMHVANIQKLYGQTKSVRITFINGDRKLIFTIGRGYLNLYTPLTEIRIRKGTSLEDHFKAVAQQVENFWDKISRYEITYGFIIFYE